MHGRLWLCKFKKKTQTTAHLFTGLQSTALHSAALHCFMISFKNFGGSMLPKLTSYEIFVNCSCGILPCKFKRITSAHLFSVVHCIALHFTQILHLNCGFSFDITSLKMSQIKLQSFTKSDKVLTQYPHKIFSIWTFYDLIKQLFTY